VFQGNIQKMQVHINDDGIAQYHLPIGDEKIDMNALIGKEITIAFNGSIDCIYCKRKTKKSFNQGYCYPCLIRLARCDSCIVKPEQCHYHEGTCREPDWGEAHCLQEHFVYLANTGTAKVGITRHVSDGVSSRWIDQGASQALPIFRVSERKLSGLVETALKSYIGDKTNWRTMLKGQITPINLMDVKEEIFEKARSEMEALTNKYGLQAISPIDSKQINIDYPVLVYPEKIKSINLDKEMEFSGLLNGIKGQYLLLDNDRVINMRKYAGYQLSVNSNIVE